MDKNINFRDRNLLFIDVETTGLSLIEHEIIEIGCVLVDGKTLEVLKTLEIKIKPQHIEKASKSGIEVSGYTPESWVDALPISQALQKLVDFAPDALIAGWKVDFDWNFINKALEENKIEHTFDYHLLDVISLAYVYFKNKPEPGGLGLRKVAPLLGINLPEQHGALVDARGAYEVYKKLLEKISFK